MKKIISVLLSVLMIASFCTVAFAAEADTTEETMVVLAAPAENEEVSGEGEVKALAAPAADESTSEETTLENATDEAVTDVANQGDGVSPLVIVLVVLAVAVVAVAVVVFLKKKGKE